MKQIKALIKRIKSYSKRNWDFDDYPIEIWRNQNAGENKAIYGAGIINWVIVGHGETPEKALIALKDNFIQYKDNNDKMPRPGTKVPLKFVSTENIEKYEKTAAEFFEKVLEMNYYEGFFSDGSCLTNFELHENEDDKKIYRNEIIKRTLLLYGLDITDIYEDPLWKIFEKIETK